MKSNIKNKANDENNKNGKNNKNNKNNKIILSIGMIVKNEEKHLEKCLSALQKLRDRVSSELIIVDTGSTDRTKEIALKYTDMVYDFEWINDFSAARNHGLEKATGEWFMFIDADEYLDDDIEEMVNFFNMPEVNKQYNSASYVIRNYGRASKKVSNQFLAPRVVRNFEGLKFHDPIHEWIPQPEPHGFFSTVFHHYGYAFESKADMDKKSKRNLEPLMKEYEKNPTNLRVLYHVCDAISDDNYFKTNEIKEKYLDEFLTEAKKDITVPYAHGAYIKYAVYYMLNGRYNDAVDMLSEFVEIEDVQKSVIIVGAYYYMLQSYLNLENYEKTYEAIKKYIEYYDKYKDNKLSLADMRFGTIQGVTEYNYEEVVIHAARCLNSLERYDEAIEYMDKMNIEEMSFIHVKVYLNILRDLLEKTHKYKFVAYCYEKFLEVDDADKTGLILFLMEQYYMEHPKEREDFIKEIAENGTKGKYIELAKIIKDDMDGKNINKKLSGFLESVDRWNDGYAEAIYLAMKNGVDLTCAIEKMGYKVLKDLLTVISEAHRYEYAETALKYCSDFDYGGGIRQMFWCVSALEAAVPISNELTPENKPIFFDFFVSLLSDYVSNIYNPDLLNPGDVEVLPELHRFGYFITLAFTAKGNGDLISYVRLMKEALRLCEPMKDVVSFYLNELEEEMK